MARVGGSGLGSFGRRAIPGDVDAPGIARRGPREDVVVQAGGRQLPRRRPGVAQVGRHRVEEQGVPSDVAGGRVIPSLLPDDEDVARAIDCHGREVGAGYEPWKVGHHDVLAVRVSGSRHGESDQVAAPHQDRIQVLVVMYDVSALDAARAGDFDVAHDAFVAGLVDDLHRSVLHAWQRRVGNRRPIQHETVAGGACRVW